LSMLMRHAAKLLCSTALDGQDDARDGLQHAALEMICALSPLLLGEATADLPGASRAFSSSDVGCAVWLKRGDDKSGPHTAGERLTLDKFDCEGSVRVTKPDGRSGWWMDSRRLQGWDPEVTGHPQLLPSPPVPTQLDVGCACWLRHVHQESGPHQSGEQLRLAEFDEDDGARVRVTKPDGSAGWWMEVSQLMRSDFSAADEGSVVVVRRNATAEQLRHWSFAASAWHQDTAAESLQRAFSVAPGESVRMQAFDAKSSRVYLVPCKGSCAGREGQWADSWLLEREEGGASEGSGEGSGGEGGGEAAVRDGLAALWREQMPTLRQFVRTPLQARHREGAEASSSSWSVERELVKLHPKAHRLLDLMRGEPSK
jgi:hypothetical protein